MRIDNVGGLTVLNSHSPALTGNNVRHAGSNSLPRCDLRSGLRRGPNPDSADSFLERFDDSSPGSGGTQTNQISRIGLLADLRWPCVWYFGAAVPSMDDVQKCCSYWFPMPRSGSRATLIGGIVGLPHNQRARCRKGRRSNCDVCEEVGRGALSNTESRPNGSEPTKPI